MASPGGPRNEQEIVMEFQNRRDRLQATWNKITELTNESAEHKLVLTQLEKMDKNRKCFRLVGDVLVERTVGETVPAVSKNRDNLEATITAIQQQFEAQKKDLMEFQTKYKVRVRSEGEEMAEARAAESKPQGQGVLVSKK